MTLNSIHRNGSNMQVYSYILANNITSTPPIHVRIGTMPSTGILTP